MCRAETQPSDQGGEHRDPDRVQLTHGRALCELALLPGLAGFRVLFSLLDVLGIEQQAVGRAVGYVGALSGCRDAAWRKA